MDLSFIGRSIEYIFSFGSKFGGIAVSAGSWLMKKYSGKEEVIENKTTERLHEITLEVQHVRTGIRQVDTLSAVVSELSRDIRGLSLRMQTVSVYTKIILVSNALLMAIITFYTIISLR